MKDVILQKFFQIERWKQAIEKGIVKHIDKACLMALTRPQTRTAMYLAIKEDRYEIAPPHTVQIPKDTPGEFRTVYVNEAADRVLLAIANDLLFELTQEMIHPSCRSYQKGVGCGQIVQKVSRKISGAHGETIGWKSDLSKYFDSVPLKFIEAAFDMVELKHGHSALIDVFRKYYRSNWYFAPDGSLREAYQSLKQGCSVASWLADVLLYHIDERLSKLDGYYVRYSDDMLFVGKDYRKAMSILCDELRVMDMKLNPKKVEYLTGDKWFRFLGYSIKGAKISMSGTRVKKFQKEIESRTIKCRDTTPRKALNSVINYLYKGDGEYSWATQILPVCNVKCDIRELDKFVMDCLRAVTTGKKDVGGLGYNAFQSDGCIQRGTGRNVKANRAKTSGTITGYITISCMQNAIVTNRDAYRALVAGL